MNTAADTSYFKSDNKLTELNTFTLAELRIDL
jgi:hypothetical protein